jgi:hypothetical protein
LLGTVAVAVVVAGAGFGAAQLGGATHHNPTDRGVPVGVAGGSAGKAPATPGSAKYALPSAPSVSCPATVPRYALPGGGSPGQFGSGGAMFDKPVSSVVVCGYRSATSPGTPTRLVLTGGKAAELVRSLENAAKQPQPAVCPAHRTAGPLAMIGVTASGAPTTTVTISTSSTDCEPTVTNGTAIRYDWSPPIDLLFDFAKLTGGQEHASPIRS